MTYSNIKEDLPSRIEISQTLCDTMNRGNYLRIEYRITKSTTTGIAITLRNYPEESSVAAYIYLSIYLRFILFFVV